MSRRGLIALAAAGQMQCSMASCDFAGNMATTLHLVGRMGAGQLAVTCESRLRGVPASCAMLGDFAR